MGRPARFAATVRVRGDRYLFEAMLVNMSSNGLDVQGIGRSKGGPWVFNVGDVRTASCGGDRFVWSSHAHKQTLHNRSLQLHDELPAVRRPAAHDTNGCPRPVSEMDRALKLQCACPAAGAARGPLTASRATKPTNKGCPSRAPLYCAVTRSRVSLT